jgi:ABC-type phosphate transport system substrate-binding protein
VIAKLNPSAKLPSQAILVVHRSDGSGTTFKFTNYPDKVSPECEIESWVQHLVRMAGPLAC